MPSPVIEQLLTQQFAGGTSFAVDMPATTTAGRLLVLIYGGEDFGANPEPGTPSGWTKKWSQVSGGIWSRLTGFAKVADGSEGGTQVTLTLGGANDGAGTIVLEISGLAAGALTDIEVGIASTGADPPSLSPSWGTANDSLFMVACCVGQGGGISAFPANYADHQTKVNFNTASTERLGFATRNLNATSDDPSTFTTGGPTTSETIAIRGTAPAAAAGAIPPFPNRALRVWPARR